MNAPVHLRVPPVTEWQPSSPLPGLPLIDLVDLLSDDLLEVLAGGDVAVPEVQRTEDAVVDLGDLLVE